MKAPVKDKVKMLFNCITGFPLLNRIVKEPATNPIPTMKNK